MSRVLDLMPLALGDPDHHPLAVDIAGLQMHRFGDAQAGGVAAGQDRTMLEAVDATEKMPHLIPTEDAR